MAKDKIVININNVLTTYLMRNFTFAFQKVKYHNK